MLSAEPAILVHLKPIRVIFLVFHCVVVALLAFCASECDFNSHNGTSRFTEIFFPLLKLAPFGERLPHYSRFIHCTEQDLEPVRKAQYSILCGRVDKAILKHQKSLAEVMALYHKPAARSSIFYFI